MDYPNWVQLAGRRLRLEEVRADPDGHVRILAAARAARDAECLCRTPALRLVTRCTLHGRHHLAVWPGEGPRHAPQCAFHRLDAEMGGRAAYESAFRESVDGVSIRFAAPLVSTPGEPRQSVGQATAPGLGRRSVGLLGLLHYLWESSKLSAWSSSSRSRSWAIVAGVLAEQIPGITINRQPAQDVLYVVPPYRADAAAANLQSFDSFMASLTADATRLRRGFILGEIKAVHSARYGLRYQLAQQNPKRQVFVDERLDAKLRGSYRNAFSDAAERVRGRRIVLFYVERSPGGFATAVDAAVMLTNRGYIPADSSYEVQMADALAAAGRSYVKPLAFDAAGEHAVTSVVFPDFVLTDAPATYVEVWGLPGREDYERRKAEKLAVYQRTAARLIEWTVTESMPTLSAELR
ncbi:DUF1173 family protein [Nocardia brasiliensis]|uniref:DUF1173 family protein n=1 Tax=Nocardia brasiliensis TaxID=37326 RepID=UPI003D8D2DC6